MVEGRGQQQLASLGITAGRRSLPRFGQLCVPISRHGSLAKVAQRPCKLLVKLARARSPRAPARVPCAPMRRLATLFVLGGMFSLLFLPALAGAADRSALSVTRLRWDGRDRPLGLIQFEPRMSWALTSPARAERQTAYQVLVASEPDKLLPGKADVWDSKKVASSDSLNVRYGGPSPLARQRAYWTVRVWDSADRPSAFARPSWWEMGLYDEEWEGQWIGRPRARGEAVDVGDRSVTYLRKTFALSGEVQRARLYASGFGAYEITLNGKRASDDLLAPGYTDYEKRVLFQTYDVTALVRRGDNVMGAIIGGGWCTAGLGGRLGVCGAEPPRVMVQLEVTLSDGTLHTVITDQTWRSHAGPITSAHLHDGEAYDARLEVRGWDTTAASDHDWAPVQQYDKEKERDLVADPGPATKVAEDIKPVKVTEPRKGTYLFDLGQNIVGWARLKTRAPAGTTITLRFAEATGTAGAADFTNLGAAKATDRYVARGDGIESWEPRFTLHGFRYVEVTGLPTRPAADAITGRVVHSLMPATGRLETSNPLVNRLFANIGWSQRGGFVNVPTTGPQRAERLGSMLEARTFAMTACLNGDVQGLYRKWIDDIRDAQHPNAAYSETAPLVHQREGGPGAGTAGILVPWALHRCYGDRTPLDAHLASMGRFLEFVRANNPDLIWAKQLGANLGDPLERGPATDKRLIATAELAYAAEALAVMARASGPALEPEAQRHQALAQKARAAFVRRFLTAEGKLTSDTQTAYALALGLALLPEADRPRAGRHLVAAVEREGKHLTTGVLGSAYLLPALSQVGRDDLAYALLLQESCPSWLCTVKEGATTIWERWDGYSRSGGLARTPASSLNHYALGAVGEWMYDAIGGIALDPRAPAGRHVLVRPRPGGGLTFARARHDSPYGPITTDWRREGKVFRLKVAVPPNATATVVLPVAGRTTESGQPLERATGVQVVRNGPAGTELTVASGAYDFSVTTQ
jgi:alpha-L-rhamnosidase